MEEVEEGEVEAIGEVEEEQTVTAVTSVADESEAA